MKKSSLLFERLPFSKMGILPFLLTFLFFASMQLDVNAQSHAFNPAAGSIPTTAKNLNEVPTGNYVSVPVAIDRLQTAMNTIREAMSHQQEGSAPYIANHRRVVYYFAIKAELENGKGVPESIAGALVVIRTTVSDYAATVEEAAVEKSAAIQLLKA